MAKKINTTDLIDRDDNDEVRPDLDPNKPFDVQANARTFGAPDLPDEERKVAKPIPLDSITPDPTQPRREVPSVVRNRARAEHLPEWEMWHQMAERQAGHEIPLKALLRGEGEGAEEDKAGLPMVDGFMALVALAASIFDKGLVNPITVSARGSGYVIESGERRFTAYSLLYGVLKLKKFSKIAAFTVPQVDVWRQAAENGSRKPLNAIGMARQISLLIMALNDDKVYEPFEAFAGKSDREFYAQVADGFIHRVPKGAGERILQATGLKSKTQFANYRAMLDIPDEVWTQADEEDWTENKIREHVLTLKNPDRFTGREPMTQNDQRPARNETVVKTMRHGGKVVGYIRLDEDGTARVQYYDSMGTPSFQDNVKASELREMSAPVSPFAIPSSKGIDYNALPATPYAPSLPQDVLNKIFQHKSGRSYQITGTVSSDKVQGFEVDSEGRRKGRITETLNRVDLFAPHAEPALNAEKPDTRLSGPDMPEGGWKPGMKVITFAGKKGTVLKTEERTVYIETDSGEQQQIFEGNMRILTAREIEAEQSEAPVDNPPSTTPPPNNILPGWAMTGRTVQNKWGHSVEILKTKWSSKFDCWVFTISTETEPEDVYLGDIRPFEDDTPIDENAPPDWAVKGTPITHLPSGTHGDVVGTVWDDLESRWYIRVQYGPDNWGDLPTDECEPYKEAIEVRSVERHPALNPHNALSVITEMQFELEYLRIMAVSYAMPAEANMITRMKALTPKALDTFLIDKGEDWALAELEKMWRACDAVTTRARTTMNTVCNEAIEVLRQKADEKRGA